MEMIVYGKYKICIKRGSKTPRKILPIYAQIIVSVILVAFIAVNFQQVHEFSAKMSACTEHRKYVCSN